LKLLTILDILPRLSMTTRPSAQVWVSNWISKQGDPLPFVLERLAGDGSTRTFYRLHLTDEQYILLDDPQWILSRDYPAHQDFLIKAQIPVPHFFEVDQKNGFLIMEDLGDELLQKHLLKDPTKKQEWLEVSAILLADLHGKTYPVPKELPASSRHFDDQKYFEEFQFTWEHLHQKFLGLPTPPAETQNRLRTFCGWLASFSPTVFCHRDYHTRNILFHDQSLFLIDFQDARLGSPHYDLSSLLFDAYLPISNSDRQKLIACYRKQVETYPLGKKINWKTFEDELAHVAYQRTIKAAGSFASFFTRYGKDTHLPYLIPALQSALELQNTCPSLQKRVESIFDISQWIKKISEKG
jgi:N-acetylmuramate 1-kinase